MKFNERNSKIPNGQTEIFKSKDKQDHCQKSEMKDKYRTRNTTLKTKATVTRTLQKTNVSLGAPEGQATPAPLVAPVVILSRQSRCIVTIDIETDLYSRQWEISIVICEMDIWYRLI